jgi:hypothetical protein
MSDGVVSRTDPDAAHTGRVRTASRLGYNAHYVVDGGKARIILSALVVPADVKDNLPMLDLLWKTCFHWKIRPHHVTGDSIYGSLENIKAVEDAGIRAFMPVRDWTHNFPGSFSKKDLRYDERRDLYVCPEGEELRHIGNSYTERVSKYRADAAICNSCALKAKCTSGSSGRLLRRSFNEHYIERVRAYHETEACKEAMRKRQVWIEPLFGEAKQWHGMEKMRLRTLERANCEALVTASGQNVKRLLEFGGRGPRRPAGSWTGPGSRPASVSLSRVAASVSTWIARWSKPLPTSTRPPPGRWTSSSVAAGSSGNLRIARRSPPSSVTVPTFV